MYIRVVKTKAEITIKISLTTYKKLRELKRLRGSPIKWLVDNAVKESYKK